MRNLTPQNTGFALALTAAVCTVILSVSGKITLYVHPRYTVFTLVLALIALLLLTIGAAAAAPQDEHRQNTSASGYSSHDSGSSPRPALTALLGAALLVPLLLAPVSQLSAERAKNAISAAGNTAATVTANSSATNDSAQNSNILSNIGALASGLADPQTPLTGQAAEITGFITADPDSSIFHLSRYAVTCCVVDAQAVSVPVYAPDWQAEYAPGEWVRVAGFFIANPDATSLTATVLHAEIVQKVSPPKDPYLAVQ